RIQIIWIDTNDIAGEHNPEFYAIITEIRIMTESAGSVVTLRHESDLLKDNPLRDKHVRDLIVYLPPGYNESGSDYPTVYCLSGFAGRGKMQLNDAAFAPNIAQRMDHLIASEIIR